MAASENAKELNTLEKKGITASLASKRHSNLDGIRSKQMASRSNDGITQMYGSKCSFEKMFVKHMSNTLRVHNSWLKMLF